MSLNLILQALILPSGTEFPGTMQELQDLMAQYYLISGQDTFSGINYGPVTPAAENRGMPWFQTDSSFNPIGWYSWAGSSWEQIPLVAPSGTTAQRPTSAQIGQMYLDTDIDVLLRWNGGSWITADGAPNEIRFVRGTDVDTVLAAYPGWSLVTDLAAQTIGVAGDGTSGGFSVRAPETTVGTETYDLVQGDLPDVTVTLLSGWGIFSGQFQNGPQAPGISPICTGLGSGATQTTGLMNTGAQSAISLIQPTRFLFCVQKNSP